MALERARRCSRLKPLVRRSIAGFCFSLLDTQQFEPHKRCGKLMEYKALNQAGRSSRLHLQKLRRIMHLSGTYILSSQ